MKKIGMKVVFFLFIGIFPLIVSGQVNDNIILAIKSGNAMELGKFLANEVDLAIDKRDETYEKSQAVIQLQSFFTQNQPSNYTIIHQGQSSRGTNYFIGRLTTTTGEFRVSIYTKEIAGRSIIEQISFERN